MAIQSVNMRNSAAAQSRTPISDRALLSRVKWHVARLAAFSLSAILDVATIPSARDFIQNIIFVFLPFKAAFNLVLSFRYFTRRGDLDHHFKFFCGPKISKNLAWVTALPRSGGLINELVFYLLLSGHEKQVLILFPRIEWRSAQDYFMEKIEGLVRKLSSGYSMDILAQLHTIDWSSISPKWSTAFAALIKTMVEHRNFEHEERIFSGKIQLDETLREAPVDLYIPQFFSDKELIHSLASELKLPAHEEVLRALDEAGQYWESFPSGDPLRQMMSDINLFYAYRHLLLRTYHNGEGHHVPAIYLRTIETQERLRRSLPAPSSKLKNMLNQLGAELEDIRLLSPDWSALIGHNGHLNVHLMMRKMGWWRGSPVLLAYKDRIANKPFLSLFSEICPTLTLGGNVTPDLWYELASLTPFIGVSHQAFAFEDGRAMYWNDAGAMALNQWEAEGKGFPLRDIYDRRLQTNDWPEAFYVWLRRRWGMGPDDWHVCLHMRDAATRNEKEGVGESIRSASLESYIDSVRHITSMGGWVIRMGGPKVPPLPDMPRVIDYARSAEQMPEMDIHLVRRARMFIGTTSGFAYVASSFGIPTAMVNALSSVGLLWSTDTRFALKPVHTSDGRMLSLHDVTSERWRWAFPTYESLTRAGLSVSESSADEILGTVKEVLELSSADRGGVDDPSSDAWKKNLCIPTFFGSSRPSRHFLEKYASELLADT